LYLYIFNLYYEAIDRSGDLYYC